MVATATPRASRHRVILNAATRVDRKRLRAALGPLKDLRIQPSTARRYTLAWVRLLAYGKRHQRWPIVDLLELDELLASHIEEMWNEGEPKSWSSDLVAGVQHFMPSAKGSVPLAWSLIQAWNRRELPCRALPLTPELVAGMAGGFLVAGYPRLAAGTLVGFDTLARTGELLSLVVDDVMVDGRAGFAGVLRFRETKTGQREGVHQSVAIENAVVRGALRYLCRDLEPGEQLLQITDFKFRQVWAHVVASLKLQEFSLRPYSMRRGGATWEWRSTLSYDSVAHRGRWASLSTCRRYVEDSASALADLRLSDWHHAQLLALGARFRQWASAEFPPDANSEGWD